MPIKSRGQNLLLARLPAKNAERLVARMQPVALEFEQIIYEHRAPIDFVYFPTSGAISALTVMDDDNAMEVATIGNEGMVGLSVLVADGESANKLIVQVPGEALRMDSATLTDEAGPDTLFRRLLLKYNAAFFTQVSQSVACNGLHSVEQRCCRWLLITLDRMESNVVPLTHDFLGIMLGVRRASVTDVLGPLSEQGLIKNVRGAITIVNRKKLEKLSCECYRRVKDEFARLMA